MKLFGFWDEEIICFRFKVILDDQKTSVIFLSFRSVEMYFQFNDDDT